MCANTTNKSISILMLADHLGHSHGRVHGGTTYFLHVLPAMRRAGVDLTVCFMADRHPAADILEKEGVEPIFLGRSKWNPRVISDVIKIIRKRNIQVMHLAGVKSNLIGRIIARVQGIPSIIHLHDAKPLTLGIRFFQRRLEQYTSVAIIVSEAIYEFARNEYRIPPDRIRIVHNGIDIDRFGVKSPDIRCAIRHELKIGDDTQVVAVIGRVVAEKGQIELIKAMRLVVKTCRNVNLLVVGEGDNRDQCENLTHKLGLGKAVIFTGQRQDIPELLAAVDVVVIPSMWEEPFGLAALEAMAAVKPVVAFESGALPTLVIHEQTGLLVPKGDIEGLSDAIKTLLTDVKLRIRLGEKARQHARNFTVERHVEKLIAIYSCLLGSDSGSSGITGA